MEELRIIESSLNEIEKTFAKVIYPRSVVIEVSSRCNLNCVQCAQNEISRPKSDMSLSLFKKIIDDVALNSPDSNVWLSNYGEPLIIGEQIADMLYYARDKGIRNTYMNTNGVLLNGRMREILMDGDLAHLIVGIDGLSADVYESIRIGAKREEVYNNVLELKREMQKRGVIRPRIEAQFIVMKENEHELEEYREFWADAGIAVRVRGRITWAGKVSGGRKFNADIERIACGNTFSTMHITQSGLVTACGNDTDAQFVIGDLTKENIKNIWRKKNEKFVELQLSHRFDELPEYCRNCVDWQAIGTLDYDERGERYFREYKLINKEESNNG
ncbi:hypothetical protein AGMMS49975_00290 [Clostridia bacterium]|nr:hypothetical protein AGMMS49975_00290 [Clostridia bacterium]